MAFPEALKKKIMGSKYNKPGASASDDDASAAGESTSASASDDAPAAKGKMNPLKKWAFEKK